jgi:hypothetical protein
MGTIKPFSKKISDVTYFGLIAASSLAFFAYEVLRALRVSFSIDEAQTYIRYLSSDVLSIFSFNVANNHFLNTLLAKIFSMIGGNQEFMLRMPNLLGYALYLVFAFLLLNKFVSRTTTVFGFLLLNLNPYVLDFFSLCRGYGLSLGFLMASFYFFASFLSGITTQKKDAERDLIFSLCAAAGSVLCNFALLDIYFALTVLAIPAFIISNRRTKGRPLEGESRPRSFLNKKTALSLIIIVAVFNILVMSRDIGLTEKLFEPIMVRIGGIDAADAKGAAVWGLDIENREIPFGGENGAWTTRSLFFLKGLLFKIPAAVLPGVRDIEIRIGRETFRYGAEELRLIADSGKDLVFRTPPPISLKRSALAYLKPAINWKGDLNFLFHGILRLILFAVIAILTIALVISAGRVAARWNILRLEQFRALAVPALALGGFVAYPLFILERNHELYWGGENSLLRDTWTSLINYSFHGRLYSPRQNLVVGLILLSALLAFAAAIGIHIRKKSVSKMIPGAAFPAVLFMVCLWTVLEKVLFGNPYLLGRTALFLVPLTALSFVFSIHYLREGVRAAKWLFISFLAAVTLLSGFHFSHTANTVMAVEWRFDADTKQMISDLHHLEIEGRPQLPALRLGVDWIFLPSLTYYKRQKDLLWLDFHNIEDRPVNDFYYLNGTFDPARMILVKDYPVSGSILVRLKENVR